MINTIISKMLIQHPFFANIILQLRKVKTDKVPVAGVSRTTLYYNEEALSQMSEFDQIFVMAHEAMHVALQHQDRLLNREMLAWNYACDAVVNAILNNYFGRCPSGCVPPCDLGLTAEEVYQEADRISLEFADLIPEEVSQSERDDIKEAIESYVRGNAPQELRRFFEHIDFEPKQCWKELLADFCMALSPDREATWNRLSRRAPNMPYKKRQRDAFIGIAIDTSGSIDADILSKFSAEVNSIKRVSGIKTVVVTADAEVHQVCEPDDELPLEFSGGGDTNFCPAINYLINRGVSAIIYLTDGYGDYPEIINLPIFWVLTEQHSAPEYGRHIIMEQ